MISYSAITNLEDLSNKLSRSILKAEKRGMMLYYQRIAQKIMDNFIPFAKEDLKRGKFSRFRVAVEELEIICSEAISKIDEYHQGKDRPIPVPRYITSPIETENGHFSSLRLLPDGEKEFGPVIFTGYGHFDQVKRDIPNFTDYGMNIIQIEIGPRSTIGKNGKVNYGQINALLPVFERAAQKNIAINLLLSPHYFPRWALEKHPHLTRCEGGFIKFCIDAPQAREIIEGHIRAVISSVGNEPALHSICLTNEPIYRQCCDDRHTKELWAEHLRRRFQDDLVAAGDCLGLEVRNFEEFPIPDWKKVEGIPLFYEWCKFNNRRFADWHRWMAGIIHGISPDIPVHAKVMPTFLWRKNVAQGVDPKLFSELSDINGNDCWCTYNHGKGEYAQDWIWQNIYYDMLRSFGNKPVFNSENHLIKDRERRIIPPEHVRTALWQGAVHGQGATTIWVWERTFNDESDTAGSIMHRPLCVRAAGETALDLMRLAPKVIALQGVEPKVGILYSIPSMVYQEKYPEELRNLYEALNFSGNRIAFVPGEHLLDGRSLPRALIVPMATHVEEKTVEGLLNYLEGDGKLILLGGECLKKTEHDRFLEFSQDLDGVITLPAGQKPLNLRESLLNYINPPSTHPRSADGRLAWGIEWLEAEEGGRRFVSTVNLTRSKLDVKWTGVGSTRVTNLVTHQDLGVDMSMEPLNPMLFELN